MKAEIVISIGTGLAFWEILYFFLLGLFAYIFIT